MKLQYNAPLSNPPRYEYQQNIVTVSQVTESSYGSKSTLEATKEGILLVRSGCCGSNRVFLPRSAISSVSMRDAKSSCSKLLGLIASLVILLAGILLILASVSYRFPPPSLWAPGMILVLMSVVVFAVNVFSGTRAKISIAMLGTGSFFPYTMCFSPSGATQALDLVRSTIEGRPVHGIYEHK